MPLWLAAALLLLSLLGIVLSRRYLRKPVQSVCVVLCVLLAVACAAYIGLTLLFVDAVQNQPPVSQKEIPAHSGRKEDICSISQRALAFSSRPC